MKVAFVNCYEENAIGMRILAAITKKTHDIKIIIMHGYSPVVQDVIESHGSTVCLNGHLRSHSTISYPITSKEYVLLKKEIVSFVPELICVSSRSNNDQLMAELLGVLVEVAPQVPIVCGGHGPSYSPEHYLCHGASFVARGEGFDVMKDILHALENKQPLTTIKNLCYLGPNGIMIANPLRPMRRAFSDIPLPLVSNEHVAFIENDTVSYQDPAFSSRDGGFRILGGYGCIGNCSYCAAPAWRAQYQKEGLNAPKHRSREKNNVLLEAERAKTHGVKSIFFCDDFFVRPITELLDFFYEYKERINLPFKAHLHSRQLVQHPELLNLVIEAGLSSYTLGFQAGTEKFARDMYARTDSFADFKTLAAKFYHEYVRLQYHFVSGTTLNTAEECEGKLDLIRELPFDPFFPGRTMLFDFRFYPHQGSQLCERYPSMQYIPAAKWSLNVMFTQIYRVATAEDAADIREKYWEGKLRLEESKELYDACLRRRQQAEKAKIADLLRKQEAVFCYTRSDCYTENAGLFSGTHAARLNVLDDERLLFEDENGERIMTTQDINTINTARIPYVIFSKNYWFAVRLRRKHRITSPIYMLR